jgi:phytoene desaturase
LLYFFEQFLLSFVQWFTKQNLTYNEQNKEYLLKKYFFRELIKMTGKKKIIIVGAGVSGLCSAILLADKGYDVTIIEKNNSTGGRARRIKEQGFTFDMGPSWYWMPEVFDNFFKKAGRKREDYYSVLQLDPAYRAIFSEGRFTDVPADWTSLKNYFEKTEKGAGEKLQKFMDEAEYKYRYGIGKFAYLPGNSPTELLKPEILKAAFSMDLFTSFHKHVRSFFKTKELIQLLEFPILFLGDIPSNTPALYSLMNHADLRLGTWYPENGIYSISESLEKLANEKGVQINLNETVTEVITQNRNVQKVRSNKGEYFCDALVNAGDYHHFEQKILSEKDRQYSKSYWEKRRMAPSCLIYYLGFSKRLNKVLHHNLFFDEDFDTHAKEIYENPKWPEKPLFYACVPSKTDANVAPQGMENVFLLIPVAPGLQDTETIREKYFNLLMNRLEKFTEQNLKEFVVYKKTYGPNDFSMDYFSYKSNAYGLANTLFQTAFLKPKLRSKKLKNLFYTGQLTVPGPGLPPAIISAEVLAEELVKVIH